MQIDVRPGGGSIARALNPYSHSPVPIGSFRPKTKDLKHYGRIKANEKSVIGNGTMGKQYLVVFIINLHWYVVKTRVQGLDGRN